MSDGFAKSIVWMSRVQQVVVHQMAGYRVEDRSAANFLYSILQNVECHMSVELV